MTQAIAQYHEPVSELTAWRAMREQADELVKSGFLPKAVNTAEKAMAIIQTGKELGLGPMQSLRSIHIIDGKPTMSADLIAGLALAKVPGSVLRVTETTDLKCVIKAGRAGAELTVFTYTMEDAKRAGLTGKQNWRNYPRAMLRARAITEAARAIFPDAVMGLFDPDELGAVTNQAGEIQVTDITPPRDDTGGAWGSHEDSPDADPQAVNRESYRRAMGIMGECDKAVFDPGCTWETMTHWRGVMGSKGQPSALGKEMSEMYRGDLNEQERKELSALWNRVDRKLTALEGKLKPPPVEASFTDPDDADGTEVLGARERQPGEDDE